MAARLSSSSPAALKRRPVRSHSPPRASWAEQLDAQQRASCAPGSLGSAAGHRGHADGASAATAQPQQAPSGPHPPASLCEAPLPSLVLPPPVSRRRSGGPAHALADAPT
eukprot:9097170-Alexandrium_andersonii.AAC.1